MRWPHCRLYNAYTSGSPVSTIEYLLGDLFETNGSGTVTTSYTDGPAGDLASYQGPPDGSSTVSFQYYDAHGDLAAEADPSGSLTASHTYDPFGAPTDSTPANTTTHRFVGAWAKQYDTTTGLVLMGARPYDPATGRFLSVDPIPGGSLNNYDYAGQDPVNNYDLDGAALIDPDDPSIGGGGAFSAPANDSGGGGFFVDADWDPSALLESGEEIDPADKGQKLTRAGRAVMKRPTIFGRMTGDVQAWNKRGADELKEILDNPETQIELKTSGNFKGGREYIGSNGVKAVFSEGGAFEYFGHSW